MSILSTLIYRFIEIPAHFIEIDKLLLKFVWKCRGMRIIKTAGGGRHQVVGFTPSNCKKYKGTVIKIVWYRRIDQCNTIENPEINPHM